MKHFLRQDRFYVVGRSSVFDSSALGDNTRNSIGVSTKAIENLCSGDVVKNHRNVLWT